jgi:ribosomal protein S18 acetylase RimI-like enzyme
MNIRKRRAGWDDRKIYSLVKNELWPYTQRTFPDSKINFRTVRDRLNGGVTFVADIGRTRTAGFLACVVKDESLFIDLLAVDPRCRRQGAGAALMQFAEKFGRKNGCRHSLLYVNDDNRNARRFYGRLGYRKLRYESFIKCYLLIKDLGGS